MLTLCSEEQLDHESYPIYSDFLDGDNVGISYGLKLLLRFC